MACTFSTAQLPKVVRSWGVFTFWLANVLRATTACTLSTSQLPKVVRTWCVLYILTSKCASRHNGVQFFISHLASWLRTRRFSEPTFRPSGAPNHWKTFLPFRASPSSFFLLFLFYSSLLSASSLLCFSSLHIVESLTSKLPSNIFQQWRWCMNECSMQRARNIMNQESRLKCLKKQILEGDHQKPPWLHEHSFYPFLPISTHFYPFLPISTPPVML